MTAASPVRVAVVGAGWAGRNIWLPLLDRHPAFRLVCVVDPDPQAQAWVRQRFTACQVHDSLREMALNGVDLAVIATPNYLHHADAIAVLEAGVDALVEKPVGLNHSEVQQIFAAARRTGARVFASRAVHYRADLMALFELLQAGEAGRVMSVRVDWIRARGIPGTDSWRMRQTAAGGGVLIDLGWHMLDVGLRVLGYPEPHRVQAFMSRELIARPGFGADWIGASGTPAEPASVEDTCFGIATSRQAGAMTFHLTWASHETVDRTVVSVCGQDGAIELQTTFGFSSNRVAQPSLSLLQRGRRRSISLPQQAVGSEYALFVDKLAQRLASHDSGDCEHEPVLVAKTVDAIYQSLREG